MERSGAIGRCPVQEQRARWERKRARTARELLETERRYQEQLGLVATYFVGILRAKGTLRPAERQTLFGPWELIYGASQELLPYLEGGHWGQGLESFCPHLELYTQFAANAERSRTTLQEQLKKNKRFRRFVRLQEGRPEFGSLHLQDLLPLPLQRLQQYENLVMALAENTGPHSPDHQQLTRAARLISETVQRVHSIGQKQKNDQHLQRIQALLSGRQAKGLTSAHTPYFLSLPFFLLPWIMVLELHRITAPASAAPTTRSLVPASGLAISSASPWGASAPNVLPLLRCAPHGQTATTTASAAEWHLCLPCPLPHGPVSTPEGLWPLRRPLWWTAQPVLSPRDATTYVHRPGGAVALAPQFDFGHQQPAELEES
ncbi:rho guanine nucleotide exchange factor 39 isoform X2 [Ursus arctos]|uniref:rho guanine nucleotide exchange factor 39 isoform X2 n=1 Tax=Ursus arctos TaxID=9644 RepID=UPI002549774A|nr:rho guanine nucleotide exchange factor 39 isoform X2 [Ursus arctos]